MPKSTFRAPLGVALICSLWSACRSPVPEEHAYTGRSAGGRSSTVTAGGAPITALGGLSSVPSFQGGRAGATSVGRGGAATAAGGDASAGAAGALDAGGAGTTEPPPPPPPVFSKAALLNSIAECSFAQIQEFVTLSSALVDAARVDAGELSEASRQASREAFLAAMDSLQVLEVFRFGPFARTGDDPAGKDYRDQIYAWPLGGRCNIETQIASESYDSAAFTTSLVNLRGMGALEFLLFYDGSDNACPDYSPLNQQGKWASIAPAELRRRKARYALVASEIVLNEAQALLASWQPGGGNYKADLAAAGSAQSKLYASAQTALNAVSNGLFYVEVEDKDMKLGIPLGLSPDCLAVSCPEALESRYARISLRNIANNLLGFSRLFHGCSASGAESIGFDDWLRDVNATSLEQRMSAALIDASQAPLGFERPLEDVLQSEPARVRALYDRIKALTDLLKSEFVSVLELELPKSTEGDND